jgi:hypothetical protein
MGFWQNRRQKKLEALWTDVRAALQDDRPRDALPLLDQLIGLEPEDLEVFLTKADVLRRLDRAEEAARILANLAQWSGAEVRERVALERAAFHLDRKQWPEAWGLLPRQPPEAGRLRWMEMALRCCYELELHHDFQRLVAQHWSEPEPAALQDPAARRSVSAIHTLLGSALEDQLDPADARARERIEAHFRRALELWPDNAEASHGLSDLQDHAQAPGDPVAAADAGRAAEAAAPADAAAPRLLPLLLQPHEAAAWLEAARALLDRRHEPDYAYRQRLELARQALERADAPRARAILDALRCPPHLQPDRRALLERIGNLAEPLAYPAVPGAEALEGQDPWTDQMLILFYLLAGLPGQARRLLDRVRTRLAARPEPLSLPALDLLEGVVLLHEGRHADAVGPLNQAREQSDALKPECFPRLIAAHLILKDRDGLDWVYGRWEKWLEAGLQASASADRLLHWEAPLSDYLELADAMGRLQSFRLQNWIRDLLQRGLGGPGVFQMLFEADASLRVNREGMRERLIELLHRHTWALQPELAALVEGPQDVRW